MAFVFPPAKQTYILMKKVLTSFFIIAVFGMTGVSAQDAEKKNTLKANPMGLIIGLGKINYERKLGDASSAQLGVSYFSYSSDGTSFSGLGLLPEYRFYVTKEALDGFYLAPFMKYNNFTLKNDEEDFKGSLNAYRFGAKAGFQWLMGKRKSFVMDLAFGGKYSDFNLKVKEGSEDDFDNENLFQGFSPELHFAIGYAF